MQVHLVDGTYELFRHYFSPMSRKSTRPFAALRGLANSMTALLREPETTHVAIAFDHVIESFRNDLFAGYKSGGGLPIDLTSQFHPAEDLCRALGLVVWPMVDVEADDGLAAGAEAYAGHPDVERILLCTPDKDLAQCVRGDRVVMLDRMRKKVVDEEAVLAKFGVSPSAIPDYLALVGDDADGIPGIPRWGAKSTASLLRRYGSIDGIPHDVSTWDIKVRGAAVLSANLEAERDAAMLYRTLATLRTEPAPAESLEQLRWTGPDLGRLEPFLEQIGAERVLARLPSPE